MSKKIQLPVRENSVLGKATNFMRKKQIYTRQDVVNFIMTECGKKESAAKASALILLSPRLQCNRKGADCRGIVLNPWGHVAYNEKLNHVKGQPMRFRFRLRKEAMEPIRHSEKYAHKYAKKHAKNIASVQKDISRQNHKVAEKETVTEKNAPESVS